MTCPYLEVQFKGSAKELENIIFDVIGSDLNMYDLPLPHNIQIKGKYNEFISQKLLRKQFIEDYLDWDGLRTAFHQIINLTGFS
jgi:ATP-dependent Lhr-like helicase